MEQRNKNIANGGGSRMGTSATEDLSEASSLTYRSTTSFYIPNALCLKQFLGVDETAWEHGYDNDGNQGPFFNVVEMGGPYIQ
eukprot:11774848-Ditylum_brightwellii.AAC.1